jgi:hypothetical protein
MRLRAIVIAVCLSVVALGAMAQVSLGRLYPPSVSASIGTPTQTPYTFIDVMHPAAVSGTVLRAIVRWTSAPSTPCTSAFKLKFLHQTSVLGSFSTVTERGPFPASNGRNEILLSPAVNVVQGDLIGITQLNASQTCGAVVQYITNEVVSLAGNSDVAAGSGSNVVSFVTGLTPSIFATSEDTTLVSVLPVAGATAGSNGSFFRTSVQLTNTDTTSSLSGTIVYHPAGASAAPGDPSTTFNLTPNQTISYPDIAASLGQSGIGSIDVFTSGVPPLVTARIFNDLGAVAGTSGFSEDAVAPADAAQQSQLIYLHMPTDVTNFRMNVGVRTLGAPVTMSVARLAASGGFLATPNIIKNYPANFFEQKSALEFAGLSALGSDGILRIQVSGGKAIIYASITDNRTNDSSIEMARTIH